MQVNLKDVMYSLVYCCLHHADRYVLVPLEHRFNSHVIWASQLGDSERENIWAIANDNMCDMCGVPLSLLVQIYALN